MIENRSGFRVCVRTGRETAGPSTALRSGRDDNSVGPLTAIRLTALGPFPCNRIVIPTGAYPDFLLRGTHQRPRVRLSVRKAAWSSPTPPTSTGNPWERRGG